MSAKRLASCFAAFAVLLALSGCAAAPVSAPASLSAIAPARIELRLPMGGPLVAEISGDAGVAGRAVAADDPVRVASISKLVTALAVMRLVEQGQLDLDRDVGEYLGWPLRNPAFPDQAITLRMIMSHTASLRDGAGYFLPLDGSLEQLLADPRAWNSEHEPGGYFTYANLGSPIIAATMEAVTGKRFDAIMQQQVFGPLELEACFNWYGCSAARRAQAVTLLRPNGDLAKDPPLAEGQAECAFIQAADGSCDLARYQIGKNGSAFSPQGGLRMSANDLLQIGKLLAAKGKPLLSEQTFADMTRANWRANGTNGDTQGGAFHAYGLGVDIQPGGWIGHVGEAYSFRAGLWVNNESREIRVRYVTMVEEAFRVGTCLQICP